MEFTAGEPSLPSLHRWCWGRSAGCVEHSRVLTAGSGRAAGNHTGLGLGPFLCQQACHSWGRATPFPLGLVGGAILQTQQVASHPNASAAGPAAHRGEGGGGGGGQWKGLKCSQVGLSCRAVRPWNSPLKRMARHQSSLCRPPLVCVDGTIALHGAQAHWIPTPPPGKVSVWSSAKKVCLFHWCACTCAAVTALSWAGGFLVTGAAGGALDLWEVRDAPG